MGCVREPAAVASGDSESSSCVRVARIAGGAKESMPLSRTNRRHSCVPEGRRTLNRRRDGASAPAVPRSGQHPPGQLLSHWGVESALEDVVGLPTLMCPYYRSERLLSALTAAGLRMVVFAGDGPALRGDRGDLFRSAGSGLGDRGLHRCPVDPRTGSARVGRGRPPAIQSPGAKGSDDHGLA
jgi:hypothetical protein